MTALFGLLDEGIQAMLPNRVFDVRDVFFNALAGFMVRHAIAAPNRERSVDAARPTTTPQ